MGRVVLALSIFTLAAGCNLFLEPNDECPIGFDESQQLRNPTTGQCEGGGGGECGVDVGDAVAGWAQCNVGCEELDEFECMTTSGCRAILTGVEEAFYDCWSVAPLGGSPLECAALDAEGCSQSDACSAVHAKQCDDSTLICSEPIGQFSTCIDEPLALPGRI